MEFQKSFNQITLYIIWEIPFWTGLIFPYRGNTTLYWDDLARTFWELINMQERKMCLPAAPRCLFPDKWLDTAITTGLFDYVWVQFFNNPSCQYNDSATELIYYWTTIQVGQLFWGCRRHRMQPLVVATSRRKFLFPRSCRTSRLPQNMEVSCFGLDIGMGLVAVYSAAITPVFLLHGY